MVGRTFSASHFGVDGTVIEIEAARERSLPQIQITGLPSETVRESRDRIRVALNSLGYDLPTSKIVVHLSPADARKNGTHFDLGIAVCLLVAEGLLDGTAIFSRGFLGELSLDGRLLAVRGALPLVEALLVDPRLKEIVVPRQNISELGVLPKNIRVFCADTLCDVIAFLRGERRLDLFCPTSEVALGGASYDGPSLDQVIGQESAKRALEIAVAGRHHLLMVGPPGVGKSMIANCSRRLIPQPTPEENFQVMKCHSREEGFNPALGAIPFRIPHHSISGAGLLGGGSQHLSSGEVTLSHLGVLFLDEFPEFRRDAIEGLREPLENGTVSIHRSGARIKLPARFLLIATMNPCPCGYSMGRTDRCRCNYDRIQKYRRKISGPIMDRMDLFVYLNSDGKTGRLANDPPESERTKRVREATEVQRHAYADSKIGSRNGDVDVSRFPERFRVPDESERWLTSKLEKSVLSFRGSTRLKRVARTIADLNHSSEIQHDHVLEAWHYRFPSDLSSEFFQ